VEPILALAESERLNLVLLSGAFDRAHYALALASAAAALGRPVVLFATLAATRAFLATAPGGRPAWTEMPLSPELATPDVADGGALDARNQARGVAGFEELVQACVDLGVEFLVCEMGLRGLGQESAELRADLPIQRAGLATLLARGGQIVVL
jgi:peroxiredoxin family protein